MLQNVALNSKAKKSFGSLESIVFTTHGEYVYLDNLIPLLQRWNGPVSMAIYAPGEGTFQGERKV